MLSRAVLLRKLARLGGFSQPRAGSEQVETPPQAAAELLYDALARGDLEGRDIVDLGSGPGRLAIGAMLLGARSVTGVEEDPRAVAIARQNSTEAGVDCRWVQGAVRNFHEFTDTVLMNPPFGAQRPHADAVFWERALALARRAVYAFSLADSRTFIARRAVERGARIETTRPVRWELPATFPHHRKPRVPLAVDLWVLRTERTHR